MAKKALRTPSVALQSANSPMKANEGGTNAKLTAAIDHLENVETARDARELLCALQREVSEEGKSGANWLRLHEQEFWPYAAKLYENGRWLHPPKSTDNPFDNQESMPPGNTFIGIVLDKTLEVSVVENLPCRKSGADSGPVPDQGGALSPFDSTGLPNSRKYRCYHRPMAVLQKGDIFGSFEAVDMLCHALPLQNYTVYSGIRTFFFDDITLDAHADSKSYTKTQLNKPSWPEDWQSTAIDDWYQPKTFSPTQTPLRLLAGVLGTHLANWKGRLLLIEVGSRFVEDAPENVKRLLLTVAWRQSSSLRRIALQAYSSDHVAVAVMNAKYPKPDQTALVRELNGLPDVVGDGRPGFHEFDACEPEPGNTRNQHELNIDDLGPFRAFFTKIASIHPSLSNNRKIYAAGRRYDAISSFLQPVWLSAFPEAEHPARETGAIGTAPMQRIKDAWPSISETLFPDDRAYLRSLVACAGPNVKQGKKLNPVFQRGCVKISSEAPFLPLFSAVASGPLTDKDHRFSTVALFGIQHLLEETVCLVQEVIRRNIVPANRIWLLGKPYSSNARITHLLRLMGVTVGSPSNGWRPGEFDSWFEAEAKRFFNKAIAQLVNDKVIGRVVLLDDGGTLINSGLEASPHPGLNFVGVEQTSRGVSAATNATFPVVLVSSCALKAMVEPEFVARAAVHKIAHYYPEALSAKTIGVVGCFGNVGNYLAQYLAARTDVHSQTRILCYDSRSVWANSITFAGAGVTDGEVKLEIVKDVTALFADAEVVYGCTGLDLGKLVKECVRRPQLFVSLSSGDIEFATALKNMMSPVSSIWGPIELKSGGVVAHAGFPVTFDGAPSSAPLIEMQLTRALLLAGILQAISMPVEASGPRKLEPEPQWKIWLHWKKIALQNEKKGSALPDPSGIAWRQQRESELGRNKLGEWLLDVANRVGGYSDFADKNDKAYNDAIARAPKT
jgi:hypothetical protein